MSINVFQASGVQFWESEQLDSYRITAATQAGRLDLLSTRFVVAQGAFARGRFQALDRILQKYFYQYAPHPSRNGFYLLPGTVEEAPSFTGLASFSAQYIGCSAFPSLPDGYLVATEPGEMTAQLSSGKTGTLHFSRYIIEHVHFDEAIPQPEKNVGKVYRLEAKFFQNETALLSLRRSEIVQTVGPFHVLRDYFEPLATATDQPVWRAYNNRISNKNALLSIDRLESVAGGGTLASSNMTLSQALDSISDDTRKIVYSGAPPKSLSLTGNTKTSSVFSRM